MRLGHSHPDLFSRIDLQMSLEIAEYQASHPDYNFIQLLDDMQKPIRELPEEMFPTEFFLTCLSFLPPPDSKKT